MSQNTAPAVLSNPALSAPPQPAQPGRSSEGSAKPDKAPKPDKTTKAKKKIPPLAVSKAKSAPTSETSEPSAKPAKSATPSEQVTQRAGRTTVRSIRPTPSESEIAAEYDIDPDDYAAQEEALDRLDPPTKLGKAVSQKKADAHEEADRSDAPEAPDDRKDETQDGEAASELMRLPERDFDALLERAERYGMTRQEFESFETRKGLESALTLLERRAREQKMERLDQPRENPSAADTDKRKPAQGSAEEDDIPDLDEQEYDPILVKAFQTVKQKFAQMREQMQAMIAHFESQRQTAMGREFDQFVAALGDDWKTFLGEGASAKLNANGPELTRRRELVREALAIQERAASRDPRNVPDWNEALLLRALRSVHGDEYDKVQARKVASQVSRRNGQLTARPSHSQPNGLTGRDRAIAAVAEHKRRISEGPDESEDDRY